MLLAPRPWFNREDPAFSSRGKGIAFLFLGCALFSTMVDNLESSTLKFLAFLLCLIPVVVGVAALVIGFIKSHKLNKARSIFAQEPSLALGF